MTAREFALQAHGDQRYGTGEPYVVHLDAVVAVLKKVYGDSLPIIVESAAYLHDVLEDTNTKPEAIEQQFGPRVREIVELLTEKPGKNRRERHLRTHPAIRTDPLAVAVKLADRIANIEASKGLGTQTGYFKMYMGESPSFIAMFYRPGEHEQLWARYHQAFEVRNEP